MYCEPGHLYYIAVLSFYMTCISTDWKLPSIRPCYPVQNTLPVTLPQITLVLPHIATVVPQNAPVLPQKVLPLPQNVQKVQPRKPYLLLQMASLLPPSLACNKQSHEHPLFRLSTAHALPHSHCVCVLYSKHHFLCKVVCACPDQFLS